MSVTVTVDIPASLTRKLDPARLNRALDGVARGVGEELKDRIAKYPGRVHHPIQWTSVKQRKFYFAMRRAMGLGPGYTRQSDPGSQRLGPSWTVRATGRGRVLVGTRVTYAKWVQSAKDQQPMHRATGWKTDRQAVRELEQSGAIRRIAYGAIRKALT